MSCRVANWMRGCSTLFLNISNLCTTLRKMLLLPSVPIDTHEGTENLRCGWLLILSFANFFFHYMIVVWVSLIPCLTVHLVWLAAGHCHLAFPQFNLVPDHILWHEPWPSLTFAHSGGFDFINSLNKSTISSERESPISTSSRPPLVFQVVRKSVMLASITTLKHLSSACGGLSCFHAGRLSLQPVLFCLCMHGVHGCRAIIPWALEGAQNVSLEHQRKDIYATWSNSCAPLTRLLKVTLQRWSRLGKISVHLCGQKVLWRIAAELAKFLNLG